MRIVGRPERPWPCSAGALLACGQNLYPNQPRLPFMPAVSSSPPPPPSDPNAPRRLRSEGLARPRTFGRTPFRQSARVHGRDLPGARPEPSSARRVWAVVNRPSRVRRRSAVRRDADAERTRRGLGHAARAVSTRQALGSSHIAMEYFEASTSLSPPHARSSGRVPHRTRWARRRRAQVSIRAPPHRRTVTTRHVHRDVPPSTSSLLRGAVSSALRIPHANDRLGIRESPNVMPAT